MKDKREVLQKSGYIIILLVAIIILFQWYTSQNSSRMVERNKNYALDSARLKAAQIDEELNNTLNLINTYTYFIGESLSEPEITAQMLAEMEKNSLFDAVMFTDMEGVDYASDGRVADVTDREFYYEGIKGNSSISIIFTPVFLMKRWHASMLLSAIRAKLSACSGERIWRRNICSICWILHISEKRLMCFSAHRTAA